MSIKIGHAILISISLSFSACNIKNNDTSIQIPPREIKTDTTDGTQFIAILKYSAVKNSIPIVKEDLAIIKSSSAKSNITLTKQDLVVIDRQLKIAVRDYNIEREEYLKKLKNEDPASTLKLEDLAIDLKNYKRQYVAYRNSRNQREVWVNCFCSSSDNEEWKSKIYSVSDGGHCYFNLKIILEKKTYIEFSVNGIA